MSQASLSIRPVAQSELPTIQQRRNQTLIERGVIPADSPLKQPWDDHSRYFTAWAQGASDRYVGFVGVTMPGAPHFGFELHIPFPNPALPTNDRSQLAEGQNLYVAPEFRMSGLGLVLAYIAPMLAQAYGAGWLVMKNDKKIPAMIPESAWRDTGIVTDHTGDRPRHLMAGRVTDVLRTFADSFRAIMARGHITFTGELSDLAAQALR